MGPASFFFKMLCSFPKTIYWQTLFLPPVNGLEILLKNHLVICDPSCFCNYFQTNYINNPKKKINKIGILWKHYVQMSKNQALSFALLYEVWHFQSPMILYARQLISSHPEKEMAFYLKKDSLKQRKGNHLNGSGRRVNKKKNLRLIPNYIFD